MRTFLRLLFSAASLTASGTLVWASLGVPHDLGFSARLVGFAMAVYGVLTGVLILLAWFRTRMWMPKTTAVLSSLFFLFMVIASFDSGMISGLEVLFLVGFAIPLIVNWLAVWLVCSR